MDEKSTCCMCVSNSDEYTIEELETSVSKGYFCQNCIKEMCLKQKSELKKRLIFIRQCTEKYKDVSLPKVSTWINKRKNKKRNCK